MKMVIKKSVRELTPYTNFFQDLCDFTMSIGTFRDPGY